MILQRIGKNTTAKEDTLKAIGELQAIREIFVVVFKRLFRQPIEIPSPSGELLKKS